MTSVSENEKHILQLQKIGIYKQRADLWQSIAEGFGRICVKADKINPTSLKSKQTIAEVLRSLFSEAKRYLDGTPTLAKAHKIHLKTYRSFLSKTKAQEMQLNAAEALAHLRDVCQKVGFALSYEFLKSKIQSELWKTAPPGGDALRGFDVGAIVEYALRRSDLANKKTPASKIIDAYLLHQNEYLQQFREGYSSKNKESLFWSNSKAGEELEKQLTRIYGRNTTTDDERKYLFSLEAVIVPRGSSSSTKRKGSETESSGKKMKKKDDFLTSSWIFAEQGKEEKKPLTRSGTKLCAEKCRREGSITGQCWCPTTDGSWDYCEQTACSK